MPSAISAEAAASGSRAKRPSSAIASKCVEYASQPCSASTARMPSCMRTWSSRSARESRGSIVELLVLGGDHGGDVGVGRGGRGADRSPGASASTCGPSTRTSVWTSTWMSPIPFIA